MRLRRLVFIVAVLLSLSSLPTSIFAQSPGLRVQGVTLVRTDGNRFISAGVNMEMYRDYANGCGWVTDGTWTIRSVMADKLKSLGVNIVRLNYKYRFLQQGDNLSKFLDMAQELAIRGVYVMPSDHSYTGGELLGSSASFPMFLKITQGFRDRGIIDYLVWNPFNEPGGDPAITWDAWLTGQKDALTYLRKTAGFSGVVMLDTKTWALEFDAATLTKLMTFDAGLRGGTPNVVFSFHYYSTNGFAPVDTAFGQADKFPIVTGEVGIYNASPVDPGYVKEVIKRWFGVAKDKGHNGLFPFQWAWCDDNGMLQDDWTDANGQPSSQPYSERSQLTAHGIIWRDLYFSKLTAINGTLVPPPTIVVQQPTSTRTLARTSPAPTSTRAVPTVTPAAASPTPSPACDATIETTITYNKKQAVATTCIRYTQ